MTLAALVASILSFHLFATATAGAGPPSSVVPSSQQAVLSSQPSPTNQPPAETTNESPTRGETSELAAIFQTLREQVLSISILVFGLCVLAVQYLLLRTSTRDAYEILQLLAINLIVTGTLFLITAGFDATQIGPGLGLLGTVAGYVLGRRASNDIPASRSGSGPGEKP